jgi:hypothetical protein
MGGPLNAKGYRPKSFKLLYVTSHIHAAPDGSFQASGHLLNALHTGAASATIAAAIRAELHKSATQQIFSGQVFSG